MKNLYDQKTLNKVYSELRQNRLKLIEQSKGFRKESTRYLKNGDDENYRLSSEVSLGLAMSANEIDGLITKLKTTFKKKTNATKRK